jgi:hypothetical protein
MNPMSETDQPDQPSLAQRWREGTIGAPSLVALLVVLVAVALGGASVGGGGGLAIILVALISMIALLVRWSKPTKESDPPAKGESEQAEAKPA